MDNTTPDHDNNDPEDSISDSDGEPATIQGEMAFQDFDIDTTAIFTSDSTSHEADASQDQNTENELSHLEQASLTSDQADQTRNLHEVGEENSEVPRSNASAIRSQRMQDLDPSLTASVQNFALKGVKFGRHGTTHFGNVINNHQYHMESSLFSIFKTDYVNIEDDLRSRYRERRQESGPQSLLDAMPDMRYRNYARVEEKGAKQSLYKIAGILQFLDTAFAEYFRVAVSCSDQITAKLDVIKDGIRARQSPNPTYLGELGEFCQSVNEEKQRKESSQSFKIKDWGDHALAYLQDGLEYPYWSLIADLFLQQCHNSTAHTTSVKVVLRVINDSRRELNLRLKRLSYYHPGVSRQILDGINLRMKVLDRLLIETSGDIENEEDLQVQDLQRAAGPLARFDEVAATKLRPTPYGHAVREGGTDLEKVSLATLFFVFLTAAMVPASIGFAKYFSITPSTDAVGSTADPDFMWLISTTLLATLGSLFSVRPLLKVTRGTWVHWASWVFFAFSIVFGVLSVGTYPFTNKCWSSTFSWLCSFWSIGAVFVSVQHTSTLAEADSAQSTNSQNYQRHSQPLEAQQGGKDTGSISSPSQYDASVSSSVLVQDSTQVYQRVNRGSRAPP